MGETHFIPFAGRFVVYRPLRHLAFLGNDALVSYLEQRGDPVAPGSGSPEIERFLEAVQYDHTELTCPPVAVPPGGPRPTDAVLLMTNRCNLRCVYCYADAGQAAETTEMTWPTAKAVLDFVSRNAAALPDSEACRPSLTFHGGGEPTVHWDMLVRCVEYLRERSPDAVVSMSSNGVWTSEQREFICRHFEGISLSMDGLAPVQDAQRPRAGGHPTFSAVRASMDAMDEAGVDYGVRMTVLPSSVDQLPESVRYLCEQSEARSIQVEPTFTDRRGHYADIALPFAEAFSLRFMEAWREGRRLGREVYYSGARPWVVAPLFCQAPLKAAVATADGRLVTCFEVFTEESPLAGDFTVGRIEAGEVRYDPEALRRFLDVQLERRRECEDCFCYWHCAGDCATRRPGSRSAAEGRCHATRSITLALLAAFMEEGDGVWFGLRETGRRPACRSADARFSEHPPSVLERAGTAPLSSSFDDDSLQETRNGS